MCGPKEAASRSLEVYLIAIFLLRLIAICASMERRMTVTTTGESYVGGAEEAKTRSGEVLCVRGKSGGNLYSLHAANL